MLDRPKLDQESAWIVNQKGHIIEFFRKLLKIGKVTLFLSTYLNSFWKEVNQSDLIVVVDHLGAEAKPCPECGDSQTGLGKGPLNGSIRDPTLTCGPKLAGLVNLGRLFNFRN